MHEEILTTEGKILFPRLSEIDILSKFHLVGGTALALYLGHRESVDFDFFTAEPFSAGLLDVFRKNAHNSFQVIQKHDSSLEFLLDGVKIFLWENHYPLVEPVVEFSGIRIASEIDIGLLKLIAVDGRTTWKDAIDLYFFDKEVMPLEQLMDKYYEIYPKDIEGLYQSIRRYLNLDELDKSPKPKILKKVGFEEAHNRVSKKLIRSAAKILDF